MLENTLAPYSDWGLLILRLAGRPAGGGWRSAVHCGTGHSHPGNRR